MFGMSFTEILVIAVIAILFLGPDKLPDTLVQVAKFFRSIKKAVTGAKEALDQELKIQELKENALSYKQKIQNSVNDIEKKADLEAFNSIPSKLEDIEDILEDEPKKTPISKKKNAPLEENKENKTDKKDSDNA